MDTGTLPEPHTRWPPYGQTACRFEADLNVFYRQIAHCVVHAGSEGTLLPAAQEVDL